MSSSPSEMSPTLLPTTRLEPFPNPVSTQPLGSFIMAERMFKFNSADNSKSDEEYLNEPYEGNKECPSVFWSPRKVSFQEDSNDNCLVFEQFANQDEHNDNRSIQSEISSVYNSRIVNFGGFGRSELKSTFYCRSNLDRSVIAGCFENEVRSDFRLASYPSYKGCKENVLTGLTVTPIFYPNQSTPRKDSQLEEIAGNATADTHKEVRQVKNKWG